MFSVAFEWRNYFKDHTAVWPLNRLAILRGNIDKNCHTNKQTIQDGRGQYPLVTSRLTSCRVIIVFGVIQKKSSSLLQHLLKRCCKSRQLVPISGANNKYVTVRRPRVTFRRRSMSCHLRRKLDTHLCHRRWQHRKTATADVYYACQLVEM